MAYERHDPTNTHPGYHSNDVEHPFFEEEESKYQNAKYDSKDDPFSGYNTREEEEKKEKEMTEFEKQVEEEQKPKYDKNEENETIQKQAAQEIVNQPEEKESPKQKKKNKTIEDAIEKAVKEEKEVITLDR